VGKIGFWGVGQRRSIKNLWHLQATYGSDAYRRKTSFDGVRYLGWGCLGIDLHFI